MTAAGPPDLDLDPRAVVADDPAELAAIDVDAERQVAGAPS